jgi:zinc and cadmium transporter
MFNVYIYSLASVVVVSLISLIGLFTLSFNAKILRKYVFLLVSLAAGALLGDAFIHLIPESINMFEASTAGLFVIIGMLIFFVLEQIFQWHHFHGDEKGHIHPIGRMILVSDGVHNFLDGVIIAASYMVSIEIGFATTLAVALHEIPQEIGDFGVLLNAGYTKIRAIFLNLLSALLAVLGAVFVFILGSFASTIVAFIVPIAAGGFIYIAAADLFPELHKTKKVLHSFAQLIVVILGIGAMLLLLVLE